MARFGSGKESGPIKAWYAAIAIIGFVVMALFDHLRQAARGGIAAGSAGIVLLLLLVNWDLRHRSWFWPAMIAIASVHAFVVFGIRWKDNDYNMYELLPAAVIDAFVCLVALHFLEKSKGR